MLNHKPTNAQATYAPCPKCASNNIDCRQYCWYCGTDLVTIQRTDDKLVQRQEVERLLAQAQLHTPHQVKQEKTARRVWFWQRSHTSRA